MAKHTKKGRKHRGKGVGSFVKKHWKGLAGLAATAGAAYLGHKHGPAIADKLGVAYRFLKGARKPRLNAWNGRSTLMSDSDYA